MIYDDESAEKLFLEAKSVYEDRGMLKWLTGFFLSDHSAIIALQSSAIEKMIRSVSKAFVSLSPENMVN